MPWYVRIRSMDRGERNVVILLPVVWLPAAKKVNLSLIDLQKTYFLGETKRGTERERETGVHESGLGSCG